MNKEIKEIIEYFEMYLYIDDRIKFDKILDYITNLQEQYNDLLEIHKIENNDIQELQDKIDKAIEYIKSCTWSNGIDNELQYSLHVPTLLNILEGDE